MSDGSGIAAILPLLIIQIPFVIGNGYLASRLNRSVPVWVILSIIPVIGYFFMLYVGYTLIFHFLDKAKEISNKLDQIGELGALNYAELGERGNEA